MIHTKPFPFSRLSIFFVFLFLFVIRASLYDTGVRAPLILGALVGMMGILDSSGRARIIHIPPWFWFFFVVG
jgi:hypothetical protein